MTYDYRKTTVRMFSGGAYGWTATCTKCSVGTWTGLGALVFLCFGRRGIGLGSGALSARTTGAGQTPSTGQSNGRQGDHKRSTKISINIKNVFRNAGCVSHLWSM